MFIFYLEFRGLLPPLAFLGFEMWMKSNGLRIFAQADGGPARWSQYHRGLLQGSSLSPTLFNFFIDSFIWETNRTVVPRKHVCTNVLAFADILALVAENKFT
jgi:hypothetical protein